MDARRGEDGATMAEYGLLLVGIAVAATLAVNLFGVRVAALFGPVQAFFP
jgi:Flp pilus assembly pilin Flp